MILVKKYTPANDSTNKVKLLILSPVDTLDEGTHIVLTLCEYHDLNKAKVCLDSLMTSEMRKSEYTLMRDSQVKGSEAWKHYNKKLKGATVTRLRILRRIIKTMDMHFDGETPNK